MGTYFSIQANPVGRDDLACDVSPSQVNAVLDNVNQSMSTYIQDSEISRFNRTPTNTTMLVSKEFAEVVGAARTVWQRSGGAFDPTVGPLVNLWGFGAGGSAAEIANRREPSRDAQREAMNKVGMQHLSLQQQQLVKSIDDLYLDLNALAKGYGVDQLSELLIENDCQDFMVDIGGEIRVGGKNAKGLPWNIGIEMPDPAKLGTLQAVVALSDISIATSGDYRNFNIINGVRVDHVIDPRIGMPSTNSIVSTTVLHPSSMWADAYATALMVLSVEDGLELADEQKFPAYIMVRHQQANGEETLEARYNSAMQAYLVDAGTDA